MATPSRPSPKGLTGLASSSQKCWPTALGGFAGGGGAFLCVLAWGCWAGLGQCLLPLPCPAFVLPCPDRKVAGSGPLQHGGPGWTFLWSLLALLASDP